MSKRKENARILLAKSHSQVLHSLNSKLPFKNKILHENQESLPPQKLSNPNSYYAGHPKSIIKRSIKSSLKKSQQLNFTHKKLIESSSPSNRIYSPNFHSNKFKTLRTYSPSLEMVSKGLSINRDVKELARKEEDLLEKMETVLQAYRKIIGKERKEKEHLVRENKKLKQKLMLNSMEKYQPRVQYNL